MGDVLRSLCLFCYFATFDLYLPKKEMYSLRGYLRNGRSVNSLCRNKTGTRILPSIEDFEPVNKFTSISKPVPIVIHFHIDIVILAGFFMGSCHLTKTLLSNRSNQYIYCYDLREEFSPNDNNFPSPRFDNQLLFG